MIPMIDIGPVGRIPQGINTTVDMKIHLLPRIMDGEKEIISPYCGVVIHTQEDMLCHFFRKNDVRNQVWERSRLASERLEDKRSRRPNLKTNRVPKQAVTMNTDAFTLLSLYDRRSHLAVTLTPTASP